MSAISTAKPKNDQVFFGMVLPPKSIKTILWHALSITERARYAVNQNVEAGLHGSENS